MLRTNDGNVTKLLRATGTSSRAPACSLNHHDGKNAPASWPVHRCGRGAFLRLSVTGSGAGTATAGRSPYTSSPGLGSLSGRPLAVLRRMGDRLDCVVAAAALGREWNDVHVVAVLVRDRSRFLGGLPGQCRSGPAGFRRDSERPVDGNAERRHTTEAYGIAAPKRPSVTRSEYQRHR